jgi:hypothetical protein
MVNKKGFLKIIEAVIAVLVILGAVLIISSNREVPEAKSLDRILPPLLDELAQNRTLRESIINNDEEPNENAIAESLKTKINNPSLEYSVEICDLTESCYLEPYPADLDGSVFASERIISADIKTENFNPKKIKVFLWKKAG